MIYLTHD